MPSYELRIFKNADTLRWACEKIRSSVAKSDNKNRFAINGMLAKVAQDPQHVLVNPIAQEAFLKMVGDYARALARDARLFGEPGFWSTPSGKHPKIFQIDIGDHSLFLDDRGLDVYVADVFGSERFVKLLAPAIPEHMTLGQIEPCQVSGYRYAFRDVKSRSMVLAADDAADFRTFIFQNLFPEHATVAVAPRVTIDDHGLSGCTSPCIDGGYVMKKLPDGAWRPLGSVLSYAEWCGMPIDHHRVKKLIRSIREISYVTREVGLAFDPTKCIRFDIDTGRVITVPGSLVEIVDASLLADEHGKIHDGDLPQDEDLLNVETVYIPNVGLRALGEELLSAAAEKILNEILRMGDDARDWSASSYTEIIGSLIASFGEVDAVPHLEGVFNQWKARGAIHDVQRELALAAYGDHLFAHVERRLQFMTGIRPRIDTEQTLNAAMQSLMLAMNFEIVPPELKGRKNEVDAFVRAREALKYLVTSERTVELVKSVLHTYLGTHGIEGLEGLPWFISMVLPLVAWGSNESTFAVNAVRVMYVFEPMRRFSWNEYVDVARWVSSIIEPDDAGPGGRLRRFSAQEPMSGGAVPSSSEPPNGGVNRVTMPSPLYGGAVLYHIPFRGVS